MPNLLSLILSTVRASDTDAFDAEWNLTAGSASVGTPSCQITSRICNSRELSFISQYDYAMS